MTRSSIFRFCPHCATTLFAFSDRGTQRQKCPNCDWIQYRNPTVGVAVVVTDASRILLGRRPDGRWCIPCGHVEWDESIEEAAVREFREETGLQVRLGYILAVKSNFHAPDHRTVGIWFAGERIGGRLEAGDDVTEVAFASLADPPPLAFPTDQEVLQLLQNDA